ncbi:MAG: peptidylprolyl isomerase [Desulfuromonadales bacterium]|nr:peptidylprolyl isomerase [Desulfuromonadales bacterium]
MKYFILLIGSFCLLTATAFAGTVVEMKTSVGVIQIELNNEKAPLSAANFLHYVDQEYYDGTIFHRVMAKFMIQGGGFDKQLERKPTQAAIKNEATNGLKNNYGTIAMARTGVVDSATSQFFINLVDNDFLNHKGETPRGYGYAVFGKVIAGMDVVEKIGKIKTIAKNYQFKNYPEPQLVIESVRRVK